MNKKTLIISGGTLSEEFTLRTIRESNADYIIGVDGGNAFLYKHSIFPTHIVGDFDSLSEDIVNYYKQETTIPIQEYNSVKDASDTEIGVRLAISLGSTDIIILGAIGTRIDHVWANVQVLCVAYKQGVKATILDEYNRIQLIDGATQLTKETAYGPFFSVFPLGGEVLHFNIRGAKYPLTDHDLIPYNSLCVSNQFQEDTVVIDFPKGLVVLMESREDL